MKQRDTVEYLSGLLQTESWSAERNRKFTEEICSEHLEKKIRKKTCKNSLIPF